MTLKRYTRLVVPLLTLCLCLSACSLLPRLPGFAPEPADPPCHTPAFPPNPNTEALGSAERFLDSAEAAAQKVGQTTTLAEIATSAGWSQDWDRVVRQDWSMSRAELDRYTGTSGICWTYVGNQDPELGLEGAYIFLTGDQPVQSIDWSPPDRVPFAPGERDWPRIGRDTPLRSSPTADPPVLYPVE